MMIIKVTHPIIHTVARETIAYPAGLIFEAPDVLAREWIEKGWAWEYKIHDIESPIGEPLPTAEVNKKRRRKAK